MAAIVGLILPACTSKSQTGADMQYDKRFPNAAHNEAEITLSLSDMSPAPVNIKMSPPRPDAMRCMSLPKMCITFVLPTVPAIYSLTDILRFSFLYLTPAFHQLFHDVDQNNNA